MKTATLSFQFIVHIIIFPKIIANINHYYKYLTIFNKSYSSWYNAQAFCEYVIGTNLISIISDDDWNEIYSIFNNTKQNKTWIGLYREPEDEIWKISDWKWIDGSSWYAFLLYCVFYWFYYVFCLYCTYS